MMISIRPKRWRCFSSLARGINSARAAGEEFASGFAWSRAALAWLVFSVSQSRAGSMAAQGTRAKADIADSAVESLIEEERAIRRAGAGTGLKLGSHP